MAADYFFISKISALNMELYRSVVVQVNMHAVKSHTDRRVIYYLKLCG